MRHFCMALALLLAVGLLGCTQQAQSAQPAVNVAEVEAAIRATDAQWLATVKTRDAEKSASFWSDDATIFAPGAAPIVGKQAIRAYVAGAFASPDFSIEWKTDKVVVAASGDMAYGTGTDVMTFKTPDNKLHTEHTNGLVVWRKQADGSWKAAIDIWNAAAPPAEAGKPAASKK
ncbi:MAG TPA: SgcJ/EcaC family oxidoreductase [Candidatus Angelobacter sp.]|nr:SgcJ/EcaC family oxidoreductase [Candidatus Angelobacter sp.]